MLDQWFSDLGDRLYLLRDRYVQWRGDRGLREAVAETLHARTAKWRERLSEHKQAIARDVSKTKLILLALSCVVLVAGLVWLYVQMRPAPSDDAPRGAYFFDLTTGKLYTGMSDQLPPTDTRSGEKVDGLPAGVRAYVFSCGSCADEKARVVAYLETYTPKVRDMIMNRPPDEEGKPPVDLSGVIAKGQWVARPPGESWKPAVPSEAKPVKNIEDEKKEHASPEGGESAEGQAEPQTMRHGGIDWVLMASPEGEMILRDAAGKPCPDGNLPAQCRP